MFELLLTYKYFILLPLAIIEGPIIAVVCGFLITLKIFNPLLVYIILIIGDLVGDAFIYYIGYRGKGLLRFFKITDEKLEKAKLYFKDNHKKAIIMSKLIHGIGFTGLIAAGASRVPYGKYFRTCVIISLIQSVIMIMIGVLFGHAYVRIGKYLNYYAAGASVIFLVILLFVFLRKAHFGKKTTIE
ncbi:MAG: VTT domain-containing protein [Candidatus Paceibacterota bacterium]